MRQMGNFILRLWNQKDARTNGEVGLKNAKKCGISPHWGEVVTILGARAFPFASLRDCDFLVFWADLRHLSLLFSVPVFGCFQKGHNLSGPACPLLASATGSVAISLTPHPTAAARVLEFGRAGVPNCGRDARAPGERDLRRITIDNAALSFYYGTELRLGGI